MSRQTTRSFAPVAALLLATLMPGAARATEPLPECRIDDVRTRYTSLAEWDRTMLDTTRRVPKTYAPDDLRSTKDAGLNDGFLVRELVLEDLSALAAAARAANAGVAVNSAYRSFQQQKESFEKYVEQVGYEKAIRFGARPGHSEHQLGTTIDFRGARSAAPPWNWADWATTAPGAWMKEHAWEYGFVMSYPRGKRLRSCMNYEPWHYRYLGRAAAAVIHERGITPRRYLWETYETAP